MTPQAHAELHQMGIMGDTEALWVFDHEGRITANLKAMIEDGEPCF